jgi:hypothetical protein
MKKIIYKILTIDPLFDKLAIFKLYRKYIGGHWYLSKNLVITKPVWTCYEPLNIQKIILKEEIYPKNELGIGVKQS